ncbi:MAG: Nif11-like leader peptide family RiPP precursor [Actinomycetota bacterium]|nr:Nif11-like leader peptide family RiPP precursor [Actinomycetota bacterium]
MTEETVKAFVERLSSDEAFRDRLAAAPTPEERQEMAREAGYDLSAEDMPAIKSALGIEELSDEDLEKVAGGIGTVTVAAATATAGAVGTAVGTVAAGTILLAAAAAAL